MLAKSKINIKKAAGAGFLTGFPVLDQIELFPEIWIIINKVKY